MEWERTFKVVFNILILINIILPSILILFSIYPIVQTISGEPSPVKGSFEGGTGTFMDPFQITTISQLQSMDDHMGSHFVIMKDIDASETLDWNNGKGFIPLGRNTNTASGKYQGIMFNGSLNGGDHKVRNLWINRSWENYQGLFGYIGPTGSVTNLILENVRAQTGSYSGCLAGWNDGTIADCLISGALTGKDWCVGGILGVNNGSLARCGSSINVTGWVYVGGAVGRNIGRMERCSSSNYSVFGSWKVGGLVGENLGTIEASYSFGGISSRSNYGSLVGSEGSGTITNSYYCIDTSFIGGVKACSPYGIHHEQFDKWLAQNMSLDIDDYLLKVEGTYHYSLSTVQDILDSFPFLFSGYSFRLMEDLDLTDHPDIVIPQFYGDVFDGNGYVLSNLTIRSYKMPTIGLFGSTSERSLIKNIILKDALIVGGDIVGCLIGRNRGTISSCRVIGSVEGGISLGGLIGENLGGTVIDCSFEGSVSGTSDLGGIIGYNKGGSIEQSSSSAKIVGTANALGGIVGYNTRSGWLGQGGTIKRCSWQGTIDGVDELGGIVGHNYGNISNCHSEGTISGRSSVGGVVGKNFMEVYLSSSYASVKSTSYYSGGLVGWNDEGYVHNCFSTGDVAGIYYAGGSVGYNLMGKIDNTSAHGSIKGTENVGGFIGVNWEGLLSDCCSSGPVNGIMHIGGFIGRDNYGSITSRCYSSGLVIGTEKVGGLIGSSYEDNHTILSSYWDIETSGQISSTGGIGKESYEMKRKAIFNDSGWDFISTWNNVEGKKRPFLRELDYSSMILTRNELIAFEDYEYYVYYEYEIPFETLPTDMTWAVVTDANDWLSMDDEGVLSGTPSIGNAGDYSVNVTLNYGDSVFACTDFVLTVMKMKDTLKILTIPPKVILEDTNYSIEFEAFNIGPYPDELIWEMRTDATFLDFFKSIPTILGTPGNSDVGEYWVNITVSDGQGRTDFLNYSLVVVNVNDPPIILTTELGPATEDVPFWTTVQALDDDPTRDDLFWSIETNGSFISFDAVTTNLSFIAENDDVGDHWVNLSVNDGNGGSDYRNFTLRVIGVNDPPTLNRTELEFEGLEDIGIYIGLDGLFFDEEKDRLSYEFFSSDNLSITVMNEVARAIPIENWNGIETVGLNVSDGLSTISAELTIMIIGVNDAPTNAEIVCETEYHNKDYQILRSNATDPDLIYGDTLKFVWSSNLSGHLGNGSTINVSMLAGRHLITLFVIDNGSESINVTKEVYVHFDGPVVVGPEKDNCWLFFVVMAIVFISIIFVIIIILLLIKYRSGSEEIITIDEKGTIDTTSQIQGTENHEMVQDIPAESPTSPLAPVLETPSQDLSQYQMVPDSINGQDIEMSINNDPIQEEV